MFVEPVRKSFFIEASSNKKIIAKWCKLHDVYICPRVMIELLIAHALKGVASQQVNNTSFYFLSPFFKKRCTSFAPHVISMML